MVDPKDEQNAAAAPLGAPITKPDSARGPAVAGGKIAGAMPPASDGTTGPVVAEATGTASLSVAAAGVGASIATAAGTAVGTSSTAAESLAVSAPSEAIAGSSPAPTPGGFGTGAFGAGAFNSRAFKTGGFSGPPQLPPVQPPHIPTTPLQDVTVEATGTVTDPPRPPPPPPPQPTETPGEEPEKRRPRRAKAAAKAGKMGGAVSARRKNEALQQILVLITAFEEVLDYDPARHHNRPRPALWVDSPEYHRTVKELLSELRQLNELLQAPSPPRRAASRKAGVFQKGAETFVAKYAATLGVGAATLTLGAVVVLLNSLGVPIESAIGSFFKRLK